MATSCQHCGSLVLRFNGVQQCSKCGAIPPPFAISLPTHSNSENRTCTLCGQPNSSALATCPSCTAQPRPQFTQQTWTCQSCGYGYNLNAMQNCSRCNRPAMASMPQSSMPQASMPQASIPQAPISTWTCGACGYTPNYSQNCQYCHQPRMLQAGNVDRWQCVCGTFNLSANAHCNACGMGKNAREFRCVLNLNGTMWICETCGFNRNWPDFNRCKQCQRMNAMGRLLESNK